MLVSIIYQPEVPMTETDLAAAVRGAVDQWMRTTPPAQRRVELRAAPAALSAALGLTTEAWLANQGHGAASVRAFLLSAPYRHLSAVFDAAPLVDTPEAFFPVPDTAGTEAGRAAALAVHGLMRLETVSYGSENDGNLFVNLVVIPGSGAFAEKSTGSMRGHTDAVSFPFNGEDDPQDDRIAPSPDVVTLIGLRNPRCVPTRLMPLADMLPLLSMADMVELKKAQYSVTAQKTFRQGTKRILGWEHVVIDAPVLRESSGGTNIRYSHNNVTAKESTGPAQLAIEHLEAACHRVAKQVVVQPGDILVINNRLALHGRSEVGRDVGRESRWILRAYAMDTSRLHPQKRQQAPHVLFP